MSVRKKPLVLVVEDEPTIRELVCVALRKDGYEVIEAEHPPQARDLAGANLSNVDLLFIDILMPHMNGDEFAKELLAKKPSLKVVFATGSNSAELGTDPASVHHDVLLEKPYTLEDMRRAVRLALSK